jgi:AcrR family transcriptional regulator
VPIDVQVDERLAAIADATLRVAQQRGADGITIRAVAAAMGGSTTLVTNYLPSRAALIKNAIDHVLARWSEDEAAALDGVAPAEQLEALARWSCTTTGDDEVMRHLLIEMLAKARGPSDVSAAMLRDAREHREHLRAAAGAASAPDPDLAADVLHLVLRGYYLASVEDPEQWTSDRVTPIVQRLVALLRADAAAAAPARAPRRRTAKKP